MQIKDLIGKTCLISKINENKPIEVNIICLSEDETKFYVQYPSGEKIWLNINEYKLVSSLSKITLSEMMFNKNNVKMIYD
jgi:hypothetical protein